MNKNELISNEIIADRIFTIRGVQVMIDKDLALFYGVKPIRLREQVKRNIARFPDDFMFQLTNDEVEFMVSQNAIPSKKHLGGYAPYVFTEQGVAAVAAVIKSSKAVQVSIQLVRTFVQMRRFITVNGTMFQRLDKNELVTNCDRFEKLKYSTSLSYIFTELYHIGASLKDLGKKWFAFSKMNISSFELLDKLKTGEIV